MAATIEQTFSDFGRGIDTLNDTILAPVAGEHILLFAGNTDAGLFGQPTDNSAGFNTWNEVYSDSDAFISFELGAEVFWKESDGDETSISIDAAGGTGGLDAIVMAGLVVDGLDAADPFDVTGYDSSATGAGSSLTAVLDAITDQDGSFLTFWALYRDDDSDGLGSFSDSMTLQVEVEQNGPPGAFDLTGFLGTQSVSGAAAHSRTWSTTASSEEVYGVMVAWNEAITFFPATAAQRLPSIEQSGAGEEITAGIGAQTLPSLFQAGQATQQITGQGAQALPGLTQAGSAEETIASNAAQILPAARQQGGAMETYTGQADQALPALEQHGDGLATDSFTGAAAQQLPALSQAGNADLGIAGQAAQVLASLRQSAFETEPVVALLRRARGFMKNIGRMMNH